MTTAFTYVPGYDTEVTVDGTDIGITGRSTGLSMSKNVLSKPIFGSKTMGKLAGQSDASFTLDGHVTVEEYAALEALRTATGNLAFTIGIGVGATDVGEYTGSCTMTSFDVQADADGEWDYRCQFDVNGEVLFTPGTAVPAPTPPTGVTEGTPGSFTPAGAQVPADLAALQALGALGQTGAWATSGDFVVLGDASHAYWDGSAWTVGEVT